MILRKWSKGCDTSIPGTTPGASGRTSHRSEAIIGRIGNVRTRLFIMKLNYNDDYEYGNETSHNSTSVLSWRKTGIHSHPLHSQAHTRSLPLSSVIGIHCTTSSSSSWLRGLDGEYYVASIFSKKAAAPLRLLFPASRRNEYEVTMRVLIYGIHAANTNDRNKIGRHANVNLNLRCCSPIFSRK